MKTLYNYRVEQIELMSGKVKIYNCQATTPLVAYRNIKEKYFMRYCYYIVYDLDHRDGWGQYIKYEYRFMSDF